MSAVQNNGRFERTAPYLKAHQVNELLQEKKGIEDTLRGPAHVSNQIQDRGTMLKQVRHIERSLHDDTPKPYAEVEIDAAVRREAELREKWSHGMPTQAEMRKSPAGSVDKHRRWESKFKADIFEWKNIRLRLHATGMIDDHPDAREVANIEQFRPEHTPTELPMHNTVIDGKMFFLPPGYIAVRNVMSEEDRAAMAARDQIAAADAAAKLAAAKPSKG